MLDPLHETLVYRLLGALYRARLLEHVELLLRLRLVKRPVFDHLLKDQHLVVELLLHALVEFHFVLLLDLVFLDDCITYVL